MNRTLDTIFLKPEIGLSVQKTLLMHLVIQDYRGNLRLELKTLKIT